MISLINYYLRSFKSTLKKQKLEIYELLFYFSFIALIISPILSFSQVSSSTNKDPLDIEVPENSNSGSSNEISAARLLNNANQSPQKAQVPNNNSSNNLENDQPSSPETKNSNFPNYNNSENLDNELSNPSNISTSSQVLSNSGNDNQNRPKFSLSYLKNTRSYIGDINAQDRDPFRKSIEVLQLEEEQSRPARLNDPKLNEKIEAIRRWALSEYKIVGIIWDVQNPKVMIMDPDKTIHLLKRNYRIGDRDGIITAINEGSITVLQEDVPMTLDLTSNR